MKKIFTIVIIALIVACSKSDNKTGNVELSGNIEGLKQGKLFIQQLKDTNLVIIDSIMISGESNFETKFQIEEPQMLYLSLDRGTTKSIDNSIHFFAEPGKMMWITAHRLTGARSACPRPMRRAVGPSTQENKNEDVSRVHRCNPCPGHDVHRRSGG